MITPAHTPALKMPPMAAQPAALTTTMSNSSSVVRRAGSADGDGPVTTAWGLT